MDNKRWICCLTPPHLPPLNSAGPTPRHLLKKWKGKRRKRTGKTVSFDVVSGEKLIKEEAKEACARPHSGIRHFLINEVNKDSMEKDYKDKGITEEDVNKESNKSEGKSWIV
jgi:hypothetical protein